MRSILTAQRDCPVMCSERLEMPPPVTVPPGAERTTTDVDRLVGARVRRRRSEIRLSQEKLAEAIGISLQQLQKYENGANRIGASRLYAIATVLDVPIGYFFTDLPETSLDTAAEGGEGEGETTASPLSDALSDVFIYDIVKTFSQIDDHYLRQKIVEMLDAFCEKLERDQRRGRRV